MPTSKAQQKATAKYVKQNYDRIEIKVPKGRKAELQARAEVRGESLNAFIGRAIQETLEHDSKGMIEEYIGYAAKVKRISASMGHALLPDKADNTIDRILDLEAARQVAKSCAPKNPVWYEEHGFTEKDEVDYLCITYQVNIADGLSEDGHKELLFTASYDLTRGVYQIIDASGRIVDTNDEVIVNSLQSKER